MTTLDTFTPSTGIPNGNNSNFLDELLLTLQLGLTASNVNSTYCCPVCTDKNGEQIYFLADLPMAFQLLTAMGYNSEESLKCCMNIVAQVNSSEYLTFAAKDFKYSSCSNNFLSCYNELTSKLGKDCCNSLETKGIVEYNTLTGTNTGSQICLILEYLTSVKPELSEAELCEAFSKLLKQGIVIRCLNGNAVITDGCTYLNELVPCTCWEVEVEKSHTSNITSDCTCPNPPVTVEAYGNGGKIYFCGKNVTSTNPNDIIVDTRKVCGECDLYVPCYCYTITYAQNNIFDAVYTNCDGLVQTFTPEVYGTYSFCSRVLPKVIVPDGGIPPIITNIGLCDANLDCSLPPHYCWEIDTYQNCVIETTSNGEPVNITVPWKGIYRVCSDTTPTSLCPINPVKITTCDSTLECWDNTVCRCFRITNIVECNITTVCNDTPITYFNVQPGIYVVCSNSQLSVTDPNATIELLSYADCAECPQNLPTRCYSVNIPVAAGIINVVSTDNTGESVINNLIPGEHLLCSATQPVALSTNPDIIIILQDPNCLKCTSKTDCYCWEFLFTPDESCTSLNVTTYCEESFSTSTFTTEGTYTVYSTGIPFASCSGIVFTAVGVYDPIQQNCSPLS